MRGKVNVLAELSMEHHAKRPVAAAGLASCMSIEKPQMAVRLREYQQKSFFIVDEATCESGLIYVVWDVVSCPTSTPCAIP